MLNYQRHDNGPEHLDGIDPKSAADELRAILAASGEGEGIVAQLGALNRWAENSGRKVGESLDLSQARLGGLEHYVWHDEIKQVVRKFTYGGAFGRTVRRLSHGLVPASPLEYFNRWAHHNALFPPITRVTGVVEATAQGLSILIEQNALHGDLPSQREVDEFMKSSGFVPMNNSPFSWTSVEKGFALFDARPANFVSVSDIPVPFDLVVVPLRVLRRAL